MRKLSNTSIAVVAIAAVAVTGSGVAYAYWTGQGAGTGTASTKSGTGAGQDVVVVQTTPLSSLAPGDTVALAGTFTNPATADVKVGVLSVSIPTDQFTTGCTSANYSVVDGSEAINGMASADDTTAWSGLSVQMENLATNQDGCKSHTLQLSYTLLAPTGGNA